VPPLDRAVPVGYKYLTTNDQQLTRGDPAARSFSVCYLKGGELLVVEAISHSKDYMEARKLIAGRMRPNLELADLQIALKDAI
jgi:3-phenylpropionate/trans-cinnamate dioxygenase ferredoxin reductase subunit